MATRRSKFAGWSYAFDAVNGSGPVAIEATPARRVTRGASNSSRLVLKRESDGMEIRSGDTILVDDPDEDTRVVVLIKQAVLGTGDFITLTALGFLNVEETVNHPDGTHDQELFLTSVTVSVYVENVIGPVNVLNEDDFKKITIDDSNKDTTFMCRKGYDTYYETYTDSFDFTDIKKAMTADPVAEEVRLRDLIVKTMYKSKKSSQSTNVRSAFTTPASEQRRTTKKKRSKKPVTAPVPKRKRLKENYPIGTRPKRGVGRPRKNPHIPKGGIKGPKSLLTEKTEGINGENGKEANMPCREEQFANIYSTVESSIELESGTCIYVSGTPGTGKTATVREVVKILYKESKNGNLNDFDYLEINGMKLLSPQSAYELLWNKISNVSVPAANLQSELESYFSNHKAERPLVVLLDELDQIASKSTAVLYNFFNWPSLSKSKLIVIAIANTMDLPERTLTNKTSSRLGLQRIQFPGYTHEELIQIIHARFEALVDDGVELKEDAIQFAARKIASVSGDARRALKICRRAVALALKQANDAKKAGEEVPYPIVVQARHINIAIIESTSSPIAQFITDLSFVAKLVMIGILSKKRKSGIAENSLGDIIDEIKQIVSVNTAKDSSQFVVDGKSILDILYEDFIIRPHGFDYVMNELIESGLVLQQNRRSDRNSMVKLNIADEEITSVFKNDSGLKYFADLTPLDN
ncbi:Origin recognition complex subunit 1 [Cyberlindnera fabianii]|uniref:Origin recognition complex subunit 1 n=1 Tax=Cyberlindnera fabianii TaxID=36022 RepID=A0A1V2L2D4_CYBFA|nr:Origin recognition complex subunit 1 [Cyberlindnera fabianii]